MSNIMETGGFMKRLYIFIFLLLFSSSFVFAQAISLDNALEQAGSFIGNNLNIDTTIAIISFSSLSDDLSNYIINGLTTSILRTENLRIVSRARISQLHSELRFQASGYVSDETAQRIGHMIGAETVITGSITRINNIYRLNIQGLEVETAIVQMSLDFDIRRDRRIRSFETGDGNVGTRTPDFANANRFDSYSPFTTLTMLGYSFANNTPLGFTVGLLGIYTTWNFMTPDLQGFNRGFEWSNNWNADGSIDGFGNFRSRNRSTNFIMDAVFGYNFNIIPDFLYIPLGFGFRRDLEFRLFDTLNHNSTAVTRTEWHYPAGGAEFNVIVETGVLLLFYRFFISGTYRFIGNNTNNFSLAVGIARDFGRWRDINW